MYAPNFLAYFNPRAPWGCSMVLGVLAVGLGYAGLLMFIPSLAVVLAVAAIVALFAFRPMIGVTLLALTSFFTGYMIDFSVYAWAREVPGLATLNAPTAEFIAVLLAAALAVAWLLRLPAWQRGVWRVPGWQWYGAFLLLAAVSAQLVYNHDTSSAWYIWLRLYVFVYVAYVVMVGRLVTTPAAWLRVAKVWFGVGVAISVYGLVSLFLVPPQGWVRAVPFSIGGFTPLGVNHNQLAEPLVAIIPIAVWLAWYYRHRAQRWLWWGVGFMVAICLLTLSRAAWLSLSLEAGIVLWLYRQAAIVKLKSLAPEAKVLLLSAAVAVVGYMTYFLTSNIVSSSSGARWEVTEIALAYASVKPWFGYGPGTFVELLANSYVYTLEYGEALDAHGLLQKMVIETGLFGLIAFVGFLGWVLWALSKRVRDDVFYQALLCMCAGAMLFQLFNTSYLNSVLWLPIGLALAGVALKKQAK